MIVRVAKALFVQEWQEFVPEGQWDADRGYWCEAALAAITAMREPTDEMIDAAAETPGMKACSATMVLHQCRGYSLDPEAFKAGSPLHQAWRAMIDAAHDSPDKGAA